MIQWRLDLSVRKRAPNLHLLRIRETIMAGLLLHLNRDGSPVDPILLDKGLSMMKHRGIDGSRSWIHEHYGLGQQNFLVCPEDVHCPLTLEVDGTVFGIAFDGRLDNRDSLADSVGLRGKDRDCPDAEIVLKAYVRWGDACFRRIRGPVALIIIDTRLPKITLYKTPIGGRELYYYGSSRCFLAATEPAALLLHPDVSTETDETAIASYFADFLPLTRESFFKGVTQLLPGERLCLTDNGLQIERETPDIGNRVIRYRDDASYLEHFRELLIQATHRVCRSSGSVGIMLSSGMDSGSVAYLASDFLSSNDKSFTAYSWSLPGFPEDDETRTIRELADHAGLNLKLLNGDDCWPLSQPENWPLSPNTPLSNGYQRLKDRVYEHASNDECKVLLNAGTGDSLYPDAHYCLADLLADRQWPLFCAEFFSHFRQSGLLGMYRSASIRQIVKQAIAWKPRATQQGQWLTAKAANSPPNLQEWPPESNEFVRPRQYRDLLGMRCCGVSTLVDFFSSRYGIEIRDPYLDWDLMDFMLSIPSYQTHREGQTKFIARNAMKGIMLDSVRTQPRTGLLISIFYYGLFDRSREWLKGLLLAPNVDWPQYVDRTWLEKALLMENPGETEAMVIWQCVAYEMWRQKFIK